MTAPMPDIVRCGRCGKPRTVDAWCASPECAEWVARQVAEQDAFLRTPKFPNRRSTAMPTLIAVVTAADGTPVDELAALIRHALQPGVTTTFDPSPSGGTSVTIAALELRHPDGEHYRDKAAGQFTSAADEAERPGEIEHEAGDVRRPQASELDTPVPDVYEDGYDGAGVQ